jgi:hypothetical protein
MPSIGRRWLPWALLLAVAVAGCRGCRCGGPPPKAPEAGSGAADAGGRPGAAGEGRSPGDVEAGAKARPTQGGAARPATEAGKEATPRETPRQKGSKSATVVKGEGAQERTAKASPSGAARSKGKPAATITSHADGEHVAVPSVTPEAGPPAHGDFQTFQPASAVIGQKEFSSGAASSPPAPGAILEPYGDPAVARGALFLPDFGNNRILGFRRVPSVNGAAADFVIGQKTFSDDTFGSGRDRMRAPLTLRAAGGKLFAVDHFQHRVLIWNEVPRASDAPADVVVGQAEFGASASGACAPDRLYVPVGLHVVDGKIIVADSYHHRVLVWNEIPSRSGTPADLVLGQPDLTTCSGGGKPSVRTLYYPGGLWSDGRRLIVADQGNHRVLIWNSFPTRNQAPADVVLGQAGMDKREPGTTAGTFRRPMSVTVSDGGRLFVSDHGNNRVLVWNGIPADSGTPADLVLGQGDFTHGARNDDDQDGLQDSRPSARTLNGPAGLLVTERGLLVGDEGNNRFLLFERR